MFRGHRLKLHSLKIDCVIVQVLVNCHDYKQLCLAASKPVFGGLRTTNAQTSLRIRAV